MTELFAFQHDQVADENLKPALIRLSDEARELFAESVNRNGAEQSGLTGDLSAAWSNRNSLVARLRTRCLGSQRTGLTYASIFSVGVVWWCSAQRRTVAEHGECSLMMRGKGLWRSSVGDRTSSDAVNRATDFERGRRIMDACGPLDRPFSLFNCHRRVAAELDQVAE